MTGQTVFESDSFLEHDGGEAFGELCVGLEAAQLVHHVGRCAVHLVDLLTSQQNVEATHP